jgi:hypothetical protein
LQRIANAQRRKMEQPQGFELPPTIKEEKEMEELSDQQAADESGLFDPRGCGELIQGDVAYDSPLPGVPVTIL